MIKYTTLRIIFLALCINIIFHSYIEAQYVVDFEDATKGAYASGNVTLNGIQWNMTEALIGSLANDFKNGDRSARMRGYGTSSLTMIENKPNGAGVVSFKYRRYGTDIQVDWRVEISSDNGLTWTQVGSTFTAPANNDTLTFSETVNIAGNIRIRIKRETESGTLDRRLNIDDITITDFTLTCADASWYYRTTNSGDWNDGSIWEASPNGINNWVDANCPPDFVANTITIRNGHTVSITSDVTIDQTIVEENAVLNWTDGILTINNGSGDDLIIFGKFRHNLSAAAPYSGGTTIRVKENAILEVNNNGTSASHYGTSTNILYENNSVLYWNVNTSANFLTAGTTYFPLAATNEVPIFRINTPNITIGAGSSTTFNGIFEVENNTVTWQNAGAKIFRNGILGAGNITQTGGPFLITGENAVLGGSGTLTLNVNDLSTVGYVNLELLNDKTVNGGSININNLSIFNANEFALSGSGSISMKSTSQLITTHENGVDGSLGGLSTITFESPLQQTVIFERSGNQNSGSTHLPDSLASIIVRNNNVLTLQNDIELTTTLEFYNNSYITSSAKTITLHNTSTSAIVNGSLTGNSGYFEGKLDWATNSGSTYHFTIGFSGYGAQGFSIDILNGTPNSIISGLLESRTQSLIYPIAYCDIETTTGPGTQVGDGTSGYDGILDQINFNLASPLQWNITNPSGGVSEYNITVSANGAQDITPVESANGVEIRYLMKNGEPGENTPNGDARPSFVSTGFYACPNQYSLAAQTSFSLFTIDGASQTAALLPVELLYLSAKATNNESIVLEWATATEINNEGFEIQRSTNGVDFNTIGWQQGFGNYSGKLNYSFTDYAVANNVNYYYRLKQMDFDGQYEYSKIVSANIHNLASFIEIYPVPANDNVFIKSSADLISAEVFDFAGRKLISEIGTKEINLSSLTPGTYFIQVNTISGSEKLKLIKN
jgi:hypothetical protein